MNHTSAMIDATRLTRAGRLTEATELIRRALRGEPAPGASSADEDDPSGAPAERRSGVIDVTPETIDAPDREPSRTGPGFRMGTSRRAAEGTRGTEDAFMPRALRSILLRSAPGAGPATGGLAKPFPLSTPDIVPDGGTFLAGSYGNHAGSRDYKLYVPSSYRGQALPLLVMLHGCTQSPDDFAAGTRMNAVADQRSCLVAYPAQAATANASKCWNWFNTRDQQRGQGEPSLIAGITRQVMRDYAVDTRRVYVAGLSAGAAAAVIMGSTYPDLYSAIGVHSGLAHGAARDLTSALSVMQHGSPSLRGIGRETAFPLRRIVPAIVFHGDRDTKVHPRNGEEVVAQLRAIATSDLGRQVEHGQVPGGHAYSRILHSDPDGEALLEHWVVHGAGHAWAGGSLAGSYTDPRGPDATREMLRFFLDHPRPTDAPAG